ncbi:diguanylate cyclase (GGDEF) domain-containing protein [Duganella sp. CF402]|uniref:diguanylate cyclase n=1 Tax=unclassified Duganella TaxID=2636909 RepID=UPI0008CB8133|nr:MULTISPECIES: diguanylate cyclase [unclassified Duganella]RZT05931.1 diguanylate cyclase (GGDEF)-like protein [Duganella sp. BK701]SEN16697.1 diguanylate cyclase (GGDEF) domain-containing protein [Duganella sp. CF402]
MKLTRLLTLSTAVLAALVIGMLSHITRDAWLHYEHTNTGLQALRLTQRAMVAAEKLAYERGPVNAVLGDQQPADPALQERLLRARAATDLALLQLERELQADIGAPHPVGMAPLYRALAAARTTVDQLAALPPDGRSAARLGGAVGQMFALVPLALDAVTGYTLASERAYPRIARTLIKARYAVELREYAGRQGSVLTVALAMRQPLTEADYAQLQALRGRVTQLRQQMLTPGDGSSPELIAAIARVDEVSLGAGQRLVQAVEQASRAGRDYGLDTGQFVQRYVPAMSPILALRDELLREAQEQAGRDHEHARYELLIASLSGVAILLALTLLILIVRRRVVVPVLRATRAVIRLGNGDYSRDPSGSSRQDEIGDMLRALSTLRTNSIERQQLELERQHLIQELRLRADTDYLTGILNRRAFTSAGAKRLRHAYDCNASQSLLLFDIDHFKMVNDTYGHEAGDLVLKRVVALVRDQLRDGELVARHGGEEFVVMPAHCSPQQAMLLAERLRKAIADAPIELADGRALQVTASFGVASASGPVASLDNLLHAADQALYSAKHKGRNRVESAA